MPPAAAEVWAKVSGGRLGEGLARQPDATARRLDQSAGGGLTGRARPLYSAGFAALAFGERRELPLWRNW
jgi:hypothetical protein